MVFSIKRKRLHHDHPSDNAQAPDPRKRKKILLILLLSILLFSNIFLFIRLIKSRSTIIKQQQVLMTVQEPADASSEIAGKWLGLCAKNSIHSIQDFHNTVENDELLAKHFSDFDWTNARMGTLETAVWTHIAYRKNEKISTTRRVIRLPKGDGYITDGKRWLRTYCCNDYVLAAAPGPLAPPVEAAAAPEPFMPAAGTDPDTELDQLAKAGGPPLGLGPDTVVNPLTESPDGVKKRKGNTIAVVPELTPQFYSITVVPEPSPLLLMGSGITILTLLAWFQRRQKFRA